MSVLVIKNRLESDLRNYGLLMGGVIGGVFGIAVPFIFAKPLPLWPWFLVLPFWLAAFLKPQLLDSVYVLWMKFGHFMGSIMSRLILGLIFFAMITPMGLVRRLCSMQSIPLKSDSRLKSYRKIRQQPIDPVTMENPY